MARRLGAWDCIYCDTRRIAGNVFGCPGCSHPRHKGVVFYPIPDGVIVTPDIAAQLGSGDPNWYCEHCDSGNIDTATECWNCGAGKGSSPSHKVTSYLQGEAPTNAAEAKAIQGDSWVDEDDSDAQDHDDSTDDDSRYAHQREVPVDSGSDFKSYPTTNRRLERESGGFGQSFQGLLDNWGSFIGGTVAVVVVFLLGILAYNVFFNTSIEDATVAGFTWDQNVRVEEFSVVHDSSWTRHPSDAYDITQSWSDTGRDEKIHDGWTTETYTGTCTKSEDYTASCTRSVPVPKTCTGTRDNGDGSFSDYTYDCSTSTTESYSCTKTRQVSYSCEKTRDVELYHYEDIYDNYYEFYIDRWITIKNYSSSGNDHTPWFNTDFVLSSPFTSGNPEIGQQRMFEELGDYVVTFTCNNVEIGENGVFSQEYSLDEWNQFIQYGEYDIEVNYFNSILSYPQP